MPEIKIKHVVSFSSEDKVHKAENLIKPETYRKWKCATPGEKSANVVLQFEKAVQIHSIDIGNENSAFVEVLVGRSSDSVSNFQVLLVASSFMSPLESRNGTHGNRVRMFGPEKLSQNAKDEKWDCVQVVCTQPFNKTITYGLTFVKFHSPPEKNEEMPKITESLKAPSKIGPFKIRYDDDDDDESVPSVGSWFGKKKTETSENSGSSANKDTLSYATIVLSSKTNTVAISSQSNAPKRKTDENIDGSQEPPTKRPATSALSKEHITYKNVLDDKPQNKNITDGSKNSKIDVKNSKTVESKKASAKNTSLLDKPSSSKKQVKVQKKVPFEKIMEKVVIVLSGFVNPLRSELRDKALDMGAKYKGDWDSSCTHLICAFLNTPKYTQVSKLKGKIVSKDWITDCYKKRQLLPWRKYILKNPSDDSSESESKFTEESEAEFTEESEDETDFSEGLEDSEEEYVVEKKKKNLLGKKAKNKAAIAPRKKNALATPKTNDSANKIKDLNTSSRKGVTGIINPRNNDSDNSCSPSLVAPSGSKDGSETEDEEALQDYMADTDVDNESGGDTEDEIRKVERKAQRQNVGTTFQNQNGVNMETELSEKPDIADLPLPELPNFFKKKHFFLYGDFDSSKQHVLQRYITAYNGVLDYYMSDKVKYVITENRWDNKFDDALSKNEDLIFVKPAWIYKCHEARKLMPYQPFIIIPDS